MTDSETKESPPKPTRRKRRRWIFLVLFLLALPPLLVLLLDLGLRTGWGSRAALGFAADRLAKSEIAIEAGEARLRLLAGRAEISDLRLSALGEETPFLTAPEARAELEWSSLLAGRPALRSLELDRPTLDLGAPLPKTTEPTEPAEPPNFDLHALRVTGATVLGPPPADSWLEAWRVEEGELTGSFVADLLELELPSARPVLRLEEGGERTFTARAGLRGPLAGPFELDDLRLEGDGLELRADGRAGLAPGEPLEADFELDAEPGVFLAEGAGSRVAASGEIDLRTLVGDVEVEARELPIELAEPWLGKDMLERMGVAATRLDLDVVITGHEDLARPLEARGELAWNRPDGRLAGADFTARLERDGPVDVANLDPRKLTGRVHVDATELPMDVLEPWVGRSELERLEAVASRLDVVADLELGEERAEGTARLAWRKNGQTLLEADARAEAQRSEGWGVAEKTLSGTAEVEARNVPPGLAEIWLARDDLERFGTPGTRVDLDATVELETDRPTGDARLTWRAGEEVLLETAVRTLEKRPGEPIRLAAEAVFLPAEEGVRRVDGELSIPSWTAFADGRVEDARLELELPDLAQTRASVERHWGGVLPEDFETWPLEGSLSARGSASGDLDNPEAELEANWRRGEASIELTASGRPLKRQGFAEATFSKVDLAFLSPDASGIVEGTLNARGRFAEDGLPEELDAELTLDGTKLAFGEIEIETLHLEARSNAQTLELERIEARLGDRLLKARGEATLERPLRRASLDVELERPTAGVELLEARAILEAGMISTEADVPAELGAGRVSARLPLAALDTLPNVAARIAGLPLERAAGPLTVEVDLQDFDAAPILALVEAEGLPTEFFASVRGDLRIDDLADPGAAQGRLEVRDLTASGPDFYLQAVEDLEARIVGHRLELERWGVELDGRRLEVAGKVFFDPEWEIRGDPAEVVERVDLEVEGTLQASVLNPYLEGGRAEGEVALDARLEGPLDALDARITVDGPEASIYYLTPYATKLSAPKAEIVARGGRFEIKDAVAQLNEGTVEAVGSYGQDGAIDIEVFLDGVRYRLDYGLSTRLSGNLRLSLPAEGRGELSGNVLLERAVIYRALDFEEVVLGQLLAAEELGTTRGDSFAEQLDLRLSIGNLDGLRIRNNLGDLRAQWSELEVRGTLAEPIVKGRVDLDPGGFIYAYGQAVRINSGHLKFPGVPGVAPELEVDTTTSLEDPSVTRTASRRSDRFLSTGSGEQETQGASGEALSVGFAGYLGNQLFGRAGGFLSQTSFSYRPTLVFFEEDPGARLTISQDLSQHLLLAISTDLRESQDQFYILDFHGFQPVPSLSAQLFTNDAGNSGATLQQTLAFGGTGDDESLPELHRLDAEPPEGITKRGLWRATGFQKGDRLPPDAEFDVEIDVTDYLRRRGYPEAEVDAELEPLKGDRVALRLEIEAGHRVRFRFEGTEVPENAQPSITSLYRSDFYEEASIEEMRQQTVLVLRGQGYLEPEVGPIRVVPDDPERPEGDCEVVIPAEGGRRVELGPPVFEGLGSEAAALAAARFNTLAERVELAAGLESADEELRETLGAIGYPEPEILGRRISEDGQTLTVELEPGPRQTVASVEVEAAEGAELEDDLARALYSALEISAGEPLESRRIATSVLGLQDVLSGRGYAEANVRPVVKPAAPGSREIDVVFKIEPGGRYRVEEFGIRGLETTRERFARRVAGFESGAVFDPDLIAAARRRLYGTDLFSRVATFTDRDADGRGTVTFDLEEKPRYYLSYGLRWESGEGAGVVVDAVDRNFAGRGITLGLRAFYTSDDELARFYTAFPKIFGTRATLEVFLEGRRKVEDTEGIIFQTNSIESTVQISLPLTDRLIGRIYGRTRNSHFFEVDPLDPFFAFDQFTSSPHLGIQLYYDRRDDNRRPTGGFFSSVDLSASDPAIGSDFQYVRFFGQTHLYRTIARLGGRPVIWAQSYRAGWVEPFETTVLPDVGFLTGGAFSIRGYEDESIGPEQFGGVEIGGEALLVINQELRFPLWSDVLRGVVFFDVGNAWEVNQDFGSGFLQGAGFGLRGSSPVGYLRLDVGFPLDRRESDDSYKVYFGFGNTF